MELKKENSPALAAVLAAAKSYADAYAVLEGKTTAHRDAQRELFRAHLPGIRFALAKTIELRAALKAALAAARANFVKQRTLAISGIRVGFRVGAGRVTFKNGERVADLVRKHFPDRFDELIETKLVPRKQALLGLSPADLRKLGVTVSGLGDQPVIQPLAGDLEKLAETLLKHADSESADDPAAPSAAA
jgi:hypothetical protein